MAEFIVNIAPEKEALVKELVEQLGGSVVETNKKKKTVKKNQPKKMFRPPFFW